VLLDDLDDPLHAQARVVTSILGFHEARLHVPARLLSDRLLPERFVGHGRREAYGFSCGELFYSLFFAAQQVLDDLLGRTLGVLALIPPRAMLSGAAAAQPGVAAPNSCGWSPVVGLKSL